jgi:hypothetical protein
MRSAVRHGGAVSAASRVMLSPHPAMTAATRESWRFTFVPLLPYDGAHMAAWSEIAQSQPDLMVAGERLLAGGEGIAFLATVRLDGGPRMHPVAPVLAAGRLYLFVVNLSPKHADLMRDRRYALHAMPPPGGGEEFYLTGRARHHAESELRRQVSAASGNRLGTQDFEELFELDISHILHTRWTGCGTQDIWPHYTRWPGARKQATSTELGNKNVHGG